MGSPIMPMGSPPMWNPHMFGNLQSPPGFQHSFPSTAGMHDPHRSHHGRWEASGYFSPGSAASSHFHPGSAMVPVYPHPVANERGVVGLDDVEALSLRVKEVLRKCTAKLDNSRTGIEDLATQRDGFALHLLEAEEDFGRMSHDWRSIEDELKHVREMMITSGNLSPRARSKLLDSMVHDPYARGANGEALLKDVRAGHGVTSPGGYRSLKSGFGHSPPSEDVSTEVVSTAAATLESWSQEHSGAHLQAPPLEQVQHNTIAAILSAAAGASHADDILEASRAGVRSSRPDMGRSAHTSPLVLRATPAQDADQNLQEVASPYSQLEESLDGDDRREQEEMRAPSTEQRRESANTLNGDGRKQHRQIPAPSTEQRRGERERACTWHRPCAPPTSNWNDEEVELMVCECGNLLRPDSIFCRKCGVTLHSAPAPHLYADHVEVPLPHLPSEGAPVLGDALDAVHRPARRHQTQPASASSGTSLGRHARAMVPGSFADSRDSDRRLRAHTEFGGRGGP